MDRQPLVLESAPYPTLQKAAENGGYPVLNLDFITSLSRARFLGLAWHAIGNFYRLSPEESLKLRDEYERIIQRL